jgi:hypothetical protein
MPADVLVKSPANAAMSESHVQQRLDEPLSELERLRAENERLRTLLELAQGTERSSAPATVVRRARLSSSILVLPGREGIAITNAIRTLRADADGARRPELQACGRTRGELRRILKKSTRAKREPGTVIPQGNPKSN